MNFYDEIVKNEKQIIELRRYFHKHPELSNQEFNTQRKIISQLEDMEIPYKVIGNTGLVATIYGNGNSNKCIGLRTDMDALPIKEETRLDFTSINKGVMHACGHDGHMAMLLGAAKVLKESSDSLDGIVKLIFQPAEEIMAGAKSLIENGALEGIDSVFALHVWGEVNSGTIAIRRGSTMAAVDYFKIRIMGKSGHGATPEKAIDAIVMAAEIISSIQGIISREINALEPAVITIGKIHGGTGANIIAEEVTLEGTTRYFSKEIGQKIEGSLRRKVDHITRSYGAKGEVDYNYVLPPVINNDSVVERIINLIPKINCKELNIEPLLISEDFSLMLEKKEGALAFIGIKDNEKSPLLHTKNFDIDESALKYGASLLAQYAFDYLRN